MRGSVRARLDVRPVIERSTQHAFVELPYTLHSRSAQWAPTELRRDTIRLMSPGRHPAHAHSDMAFFVAEYGGRAVARLAVMLRRGHREGSFGLFESIDDSEAAVALFETACEWLSARGARTVTGPRGAGSHAGAVLVDGFDHPAVIGVAWNPPYYGPLLEAAGFEPASDYLSGRFPGTHRLNARLYEIARRAQDQGGYAVKRFDSRRELRSWADRIVPAVLESLSTMAEHVAPTSDEVADLVRMLTMVANPRGIVLVLHDGDPVGFLLAYPDLAAELRAAGGRLTPSSLARLALARSTSRSYVINGLGVVPRHRGAGANAVLYTAIADTLTGPAGLGVNRVEVVQVNTSNRASIQDMGKLGVTWYKRHRRYRRTL